MTQCQDTCLSCMRLVSHPCSQTNRNQQVQSFDFECYIYAWFWRWNPVLLHTTHALSPLKLSLSWEQFLTNAYQQSDQIHQIPFFVSTKINHKILHGLPRNFFQVTRLLVQVQVHICRNGGGEIKCEEIYFSSFLEDLIIKTQF